MQLLELESVISEDDTSWQNNVRCRFLSCGQPLSKHDGPNLECAETDCTEFVWPDL